MSLDDVGILSHLLSCSVTLSTWSCSKDSGALIISGYNLCFHSQVLRPSIASRYGVFWRLASLERVSARVTTECMASKEAGSFVLELFYILFVVSVLESMRRLDVVVRDAMAGTLLVVWVRLDAEGVAAR